MAAVSTIDDIISITKDMTSKEIKSNERIRKFLTRDATMTVAREMIQATVDVHL